MRPDRLAAGLLTWAAHVLCLKAHEAQPGAPAFQELLTQAGPATPILMITTPGADPSQVGDATVAAALVDSWIGPVAG